MDKGIRGVLAGTTMTLIGLIMFLSTEGILPLMGLGFLIGGVCGLIGGLILLAVRKTNINTAEENQ